MQQHQLPQIVIVDALLVNLHKPFLIIELHYSVVREEAVFVSPWVLIRLASSKHSLLNLSWSAVTNLASI